MKVQYPFPLDRLDLKTRFQKLEKLRWNSV